MQEDNILINNKNMKKSTYQSGVAKPFFVIDKTIKSKRTIEKLSDHSQVDEHGYIEN